MKSSWSVLHRTAPLPLATAVVIATEGSYYKALGKVKGHKDWAVGRYKRFGPKQTGKPDDVTFWSKEAMKSYPVFEIRKDS